MSKRADQLSVNPNHTLLMLIMGKFYLYSSRCQKISEPDLPVFITRTKRVYNIELYIARENDKLLQHLKK